MPNIYEQFKALLPGDPQLVAKVVLEGPEFCTVQHLGGADVLGVYGYNGHVAMVQGTAALDSLVYVKGGVIVGPAPNLPVEEIILFGLEP